MFLDNDLDNVRGPVLKQWVIFNQSLNKLVFYIVFFKNLTCYTAFLILLFFSVKFNGGWIKLKVHSLN